MLHPPDHAALLARQDFVIPPGDFTAAERAILAKYGRWLEALAGGQISPITPGQQQFVAVAKSERPPETEFEHAWVAVMRQRAVGDVVVRTFQALAQARADKTALESEYSAARAAVLALVRKQLDAVDDAFAARLSDATDAAAKAEQAVRELVIRLRKSFHLAGIRAAYNAPRVTWDTPKLEEYAATHPEVIAFRKLGKEWVNLRFMDKPPGEGTAPGTDTPANEPEMPE